MTVDPRKSDAICKRCPVRRACATKDGLPNCAAQFFESTQTQTPSTDKLQSEVASLKRRLKNLEERFENLVRLSTPDGG